MMNSWTRQVGQQVPLVDSLQVVVLQIGKGEVTLGFQGRETCSQEFVTWAARQRRGTGFFTSSNGETPMLVMNCGAGQRIEVDDRHDLVVEQAHGPFVRLSLAGRTTMPSVTMSVEHMDHMTSNHVNRN